MGQIADEHEEWYAAQGLRVSFTQAYSWTSDDLAVPVPSRIANTQTAVQDACRLAHADNPKNALYGFRREVVLDGAGAKHYNLMVYFRNTEEVTQLDPSNLNGAPVMAFGQVLSADDLKQRGIGLAEVDIKRTPANQ